ncbi:MAG: type I DNA topoisomerase, partial [Phycisphaerae bacterium]
ADGFRPTYQVLASRRSAVKELSKDARRAREVYLATDLDREGEAIAWHLVHALGLDEQKVRRVIFNEITAAAIRRAFAQPRGIDLHKVNAQQARRILDRIVGYELSPLLWRKIAKGLSAGRVQSVAVRLVVDREDRIRNFVPQESWRVIGYFTTAVDEADELAGQWRELLSEAGQGQSDRWAGRQSQWLLEHRSFRAELVSLNGQAFKPESVQAVRPVAEALGFVCERTEEKPWPEYADRGLKRIELVGRTDRQRAAAFRVRSVETRKTRTNPPPPFITATLEQVAANQLGFSSWRTMRIAQALYEGVDLGGTEGSVALITYMRTDSTNLSGESVEAARRFIEQRFGRQYLPGKPSRYGSSARAQEAHEAIRPTDVSRTPESLRGRLRADYLKLYELIWKRFVACQMSPARWEATTAMIESQTAIGLVSFKATGRRLLFDGFMKVAGLTSSAGEQVLPELQVDQPVAVLQIDPQQHFSSPPPRYSEASLIKALEAEGIGRPSTYATILQTIQDRGYVRQINRRFHPTDLGREVTERLVRYFPKIMDVKFTSHMEDQLDKIEEAHLDWVEVLNEFYEPFREALEQANAEMVASKSEPSEHACPKCGRLMVYRWSSKGRFLACSGYPKCTASYDVDEQGRPVVPQATEHRCERCGKPMILRRSRRGSFLGCSGYPDCSYTVACDEQGQPLKLVKEEEFRLPCEACGGELVVKRRGRR